MPLLGFLVKMALLTNSLNLSESVRNSCSLPISPYLCRKLHRASLYDIADFNVLDDMDNNLINASYDLGATKLGDLPSCHLPSVYERRAKWSSVGLYSKLESLHADPFDWWEPCYYSGNGY